RNPNRQITGRVLAALGEWDSEGGRPPRGINLFEAGRLLLLATTPSGVPLPGNSRIPLLKEAVGGETDLAAQPQPFPHERSSSAVDAVVEKAVNSLSTITNA